LYKDSAPGPGKYKVASSNIKGFSFGKEKRADIVILTFKLFSLFD